MRVKATICRAQEAHQLHLATHDPLESRRIIAAAAAKAWGLEAIQAEKREAGILNPLEKLDADITREFADEESAEKEDDPR